MHEPWANVPSAPEAVRGEGIPSCPNLEPTFRLLIKISTKINIIYNFLNDLKDRTKILG